MSKDIPESTVKLLDEEAKAVAEHQQKITRVCHSISKILVEEELNMGDMLEVFEMFNRKANKLFEKVTIKEIIINYE